MNFPERLRVVIDKTGLSREEFAECAAVSRSQIFNYLKGASEPSLTFFSNIKGVFSWIDLEWLVTGKQPVTVSDHLPVYLPKIGPTEKRKLQLVNAVIRVVDEGDDKKLAALEAQLDLIDPGEKKQRVANEQNGRVGA
jgi:transcriptional regulator with XRE-family HTH domain